MRLPASAPFPLLDLGMHGTVANVCSDLFLILRSFLVLQKEKKNLCILFWIG
jgi:hypothetical protein